MKNVIIISKCLKVSELNQAENSYHFHFKGVYAGESVKRVILLGSKEQYIRKGQEYLMYVQLVSFHEGTLKGKILKYRSLDECWDKA